VSSRNCGKNDCFQVTRSGSRATKRVQTQSPLLAQRAFFTGGEGNGISVRANWPARISGCRYDLPRRTAPGAQSAGGGRQSCVARFHADVLPECCSICSRDLSLEPPRNYLIPTRLRPAQPLRESILLLLP